MMKPNTMLTTYFAGSIMLAVASLVQWIHFLSTDETVLRYFFALLCLFWAIMAVFFGLDLFKGDYMVINAQVLEIKNNRVWLKWETGRKTSVVVTDQDLLKRLARHKQVELLLTRRTKQFKSIRLKSENK